MLAHTEGKGLDPAAGVDRADPEQSPVARVLARRSSWLALWGLALFTWGALFASPAFDWLDSGELAAAGASLGVGHPPGAAGLSLLLHAAAMVPIAAMGFRMSILSAAMTSLALVMIAERLLARGLSVAVISAILAWTASAWTFAHHMRVVEIYPYGALLVAAVVWGLDPLRDAQERDGPRSIAALAGTVGIWGMGELRLCLAPLLVLMWTLAWRRGEVWTRRAPLAVLLGSLPVLSLPLASMRGPLADWGDPQSASRLWAHLQASSIRAAFADQILPSEASTWARNGALVLAQLEEDLGFLGPASLVVAALLAWWGVTSQSSARRGQGVDLGANAAIEQVAARQRDEGVSSESGLLRILSWIVCVEVFYAIGINPMGVIDRQTGMIVAMLGPTLIVLSLWHWLGRWPSARAWLVVPVLVLGVLPAQRASLPHLAESASFGPHEWTAGVLVQLPPRALLLTQSDDLSAGVLASQVLDEARPDVSSVVAQHLHKAPPDRVRDKDSLTAMRISWLAAASASNEADRIRAVLRAHQGPLCIEGAGASVMSGIAWHSSQGGLPIDVFPARWAVTKGPLVGRLWSEASVVMDGADVLGAAQIRPGHLTADSAFLRARESVARLGALLSIPRDRKRVARGVHELARSRAERGGLTHEVWLDSERLYTLILTEIDADDVMALTSLGAVHDRFDRKESAIALTRRALELEPERASALRNLALYLSRAPDNTSKREALELIERACKFEPGPACERRRREVCDRVGPQLCTERL